MSDTTSLLLRPTTINPSPPPPQQNQYVAFYDWMRRVFGAQALVHFGMHGTAEWLPGSPLGNTATTWPDILMGVSRRMHMQWSGQDWKNAM